MMNKNMMGQMPGMQDTAGIAMQQALAAQEAIAAQQQISTQFSPQTVQAGQGLYGTDQQKKMSLAQGGTSAALI